MSKQDQTMSEHILFRIPFTWYWVARVSPFYPEAEVQKKLFCLAVKKWDQTKGIYYWSFIL